MEISKPKVCNLTAHGHISGVPKLFERITNLQNAVYEEINYPSRAVLHFERISLVVHNTGSYMIMGARSHKEIRETLEQFEEMLK